MACASWACDLSISPPLVVGKLHLPPGRVCTSGQEHIIVIITCIIPTICNDKEK